MQKLSKNDAVVVFRLEPAVLEAPSVEHCVLRVMAVVGPSLTPITISLLCCFNKSSDKGQECLESAEECSMCGLDRVIQFDQLLEHCARLRRLWVQASDGLLYMVISQQFISTSACKPTLKQCHQLKSCLCSF